MSDKTEQWLKYGLAIALDLPTEGTTPSNVGGPSAPTNTDRVPPIDTTPSQLPPDQSAAVTITPFMIVAGLGLLLVLRSAKVI